MITLLTKKQAFFSVESYPIKILYVEDNLDDRIILEEYLADSINVSSIENCTSIASSVALLESHDFDLILLDLSLPDAHGIEAVTKLIEVTNSSVPIIVLTGLNDHKLALKALNHGAQDFLVKGDYNTILLNKAIRYSIERHKVQFELIQKTNEVIISKNRLSKAEEMANLGSWEIDVLSKTVRLSNGMARLLELENGVEVISYDEFLGHVHEEDKYKCLRSVLEANDHNASAVIETRFVKSDGQIMETLCKAEIDTRFSGSQNVIYGITLDISNIKEAERVKEEFTNMLAEKVQERTEELEETKQQLERSLLKEKELGVLKSRFVSTASHQFRTPLTVIQSNIGLLEMQVDKISEEAKPLLEKVTSRIKSEVVRMTDIMNDVLILGKINSGGIVPVPEPVDLVGICNNVVEKYNEIQEDGREAMVKVIGNRQPVMLDINLMEQALSNIISNAFKYSIGRPAPEVILNFNGKNVDLEIKDYGMGIPENDLKDLFTPFYRASNVLDIPGTGLGTTIMKEYIEINKGKINVESDLNLGTIFNIQFSLENNEENIDS